MNFLQSYRFFVIGLLCLSSLIPNKATAQDNFFLDGIDASNLRVWYGLKLGMCLGDTSPKEDSIGKFKLSFKVRMNKNYFANVVSIYDVGFSWQILKDVTFGTSFRTVEKVNQLSTSLYTDLSFSKEVYRDLGFEMRGRYQRALMKFPYDKENTTYVLEHRFRPKFKMFKSINKKVKFFVAGELFMDLGKSNLFETTRERVFLGIDYKYSKGTKIRLHYLFEKDLDKSVYSHTLNIAYMFSYKKKEA